MRCTSHLVYVNTSGICQTYRHVPNAMYSLQKVAPDDGLIHSETCRASNESKVKSQEFCSSCWFIYIQF